MIISPFSLSPPFHNFFSFSAWAENQPEKPQLEKSDPNRGFNIFKDHSCHLETLTPSIKNRRSPLEGQPEKDTSENCQKKFIDFDLSDIDLSVPFPEQSSVLKDDNENECLSLQGQDTTKTSRRNNDGSLENPTWVLGTRLEAYVERLVCQTIFKSDKVFIDVFLCLYRQFATPGELLSSMLSRLESSESEQGSHYMIRIEKEFRSLNIISKWITTYPGDLAGPSTSQKLIKYLNSIIDKPECALTAIEIKSKHQLLAVIDDDTRWGKTDPDVEMMFDQSNSAMDYKSPYSSYNSVRKGLDSHLSVQDFKNDGNEEMNPRNSRGGIWSQLGSAAPTFSTIEDFDKEAASIFPRNSTPLSKPHFCAFMQIPEDEISNEITRIDWVMFSSIRPRDLVRHVCLASKLCKGFKGLESVKRMIDHFNHISAWVANMILMRDKAKHRALVLEKFVKIALKLRHLNNYNDLAAVIAGINNSAIYRLTYTWSLVPSDILDQLNSLMILMGTQQGYFAYRLAWKCTNSFRIPFLPLHRRDLVVAEQASRRFLGMSQESINVKKFEVFSEIISPIIKSQMVPCPILVKSKSTRDLILDCKILNDEELYQRSLAVEHCGSPMTEFAKKKFFWF